MAVKHFITVLICVCSFYCTQAESNRIVNGFPINQEDIPYFAIVSQYKMASNGTGTGIPTFGALISNKHVITIALSLDRDINEWIVHLGCYDYFNCSITRNTKNSIAHFQYDQATKANDIRLVILESPIEFSIRIQPIVMPAMGSSGPVGYNGMISAYNFTSYSYSASYQQFLSYDDCQIAFPVAKNSSLNFCTSDPIVQGTPCDSSDYGGPFIMKNSNNESVFVGMVIQAPSCFQLGRPSLYTKISGYRLWIFMLTGI